MSRTPLSVMHLIPDAKSVGTWATALNRVHSDSRSLKPYDCFVALQGERFDGHDYLPQLKASGVHMALAQGQLAAHNLSGAEVPDTLLALGQWATLWRAELSMPLIAVTGSNGKTTVTQMIASILRTEFGDDMHATQGNYNNQIGVPLTLLGLRPTHKAAVVELGMNHPGEIDKLARMACPTVALVNNAQREHQEFMSSVQAVAEENAAVFAHLRAGGVGVFPIDDAFHGLWQARMAQVAPEAKVWTFGIDAPDATVWAKVQPEAAHWRLELHTPVGEAVINMAVAGRHNALNAVAAAACALAAGVPLSAVCEGLSAFQAVGGRSRPLALQLGTHTLYAIDDTYNANPDSMLAAIAVLASMPKPQWLVLGDMAEVGDQALGFHQEVIRSALAAQIDRIDVTGEWMQQAAASFGDSPSLHAWQDVAALTMAAPALAMPMASALIKGSRSMRMERLLGALEAPQPERTPHAA